MLTTIQSFMSDKPAIVGGHTIRQVPFESRVTMGEQESKATQKALNSDVLSAFIAAEGKFFKGGEMVRKFEQT